MANKKHRIHNLVPKTVKGSFRGIHSALRAKEERQQLRSEKEGQATSHYAMEYLVW